MRLAPILVPAGLVLAIGGGVMTFAVLHSSARQPAPDRMDPKDITVLVRHPVTYAMLCQTSDKSEKIAPYFKVKDAHGIDVQIGGAGSKPQFIYFILDGCPCSLDAQPLFNELYQRYKNVVEFIGVTNGSKGQAIDYAGSETVIHPIVSDEKLDIMKAFGARESTYNVIVRPDGRIEKMWPGFSKDILQDLNHRLAALTGQKEAPFDASLAPKVKDSGCYFY